MSADSSSRSSAWADLVEPVAVERFGGFSATANASPDLGDAPLAVQFSASAAGGLSPYHYAWVFGDTDLGLGPDPIHIFSPGSFDVHLWVNDSANSTATANVTVRVLPSIVVTFTMSGPSSCGTPYTVSFVSTVTGGDPPYGLRWDFGDGATSNLSDPAHMYTNSPTGPVTLTVTDSTGTQGVGQEPAIEPTTCNPYGILGGETTVVAIVVVGVVTAAFVVVWYRRRPPPPSRSVQDGATDEATPH